MDIKQQKKNFRHLKDFHPPPQTLAHPPNTPLPPSQTKGYYEATTSYFTRFSLPLSISRVGPPILDSNGFLFFFHNRVTKQVLGRTLKLLASTAHNNVMHFIAFFSFCFFGVVVDFFVKQPVTAVRAFGLDPRLFFFWSLASMVKKKSLKKRRKKKQELEGQGE